MLHALALAALLAAAPAPPPAPGERAPVRPLVVFRGNVLFNEFLYRSLLQLPPTAKATPAEARAIAGRLRSFLIRAGYELAVVRAKVEGDQIVVDLDEGQLDKVIILGQGIFETLRFKLELSVPARVFNRLALEEQLNELAQRYHLRDYAYELVGVETNEPAGPQLEELEPLLGVPGVRPGTRYELHILVSSNPWSHGLAPDIELNGLEGLGVGGHYRDGDLLLRDDRWEVKARGAMALRGHVEAPGSSPLFTRARAEGRWFSPPVLLEGLRPSVGVLGDLLSRQRTDLRLEAFNQVILAASADAAETFLPGLSLSLGFGFERRILFGLDVLSGATPQVLNTPRTQSRVYSQTSAELIFNPSELRTDRKDRILFDARLYAPGTGLSGGEGELIVRASFEKLWRLGWNELWFHVRGTLLAGQVLFPDEEPIGEHTHGPYGNSDFSRKLASVGGEFRYSFLRDVAKVGFYYDQIAFGAIDRTTLDESLQTAGVFGPALHLLLADEFQFDTYAGMGWKTNGGVEYGIAIVLRQVF